MIYHRHTTGAAALALLLGPLAAPALAQNVASWVSQSGSNSNNCTYSAPCRTFAGALTKTNAGGVIKCRETGEYGDIAIDKSIEIDCKETGGAIFATGDAISIAGTGIDVVLRGLTVRGYSGGGASGYDAIWIGLANSVTVEDCVFRNFRQASPNGNGIRLMTSAGTVELDVRRTEIVNNGRLGIAVEPSGSGSAKVTVEGSSLGNNAAGIRADTANTTGSIDLTVTDSHVTGNSSHGIIVNAGSGAIRASIDGTTLAGNGMAGLRVSGANATVLLGRSNITNNTTGTEVASGGRLFSYGTNQINNNTNNGANPAVIVQK